MALPVLVAGGGIGGLTAALCLHAQGVPVRVFERAAELRPLGVGITLLPQAVQVLHGLQLGEALAAAGVEITSLAYYNKLGQLIWREPRGREAGAPHCQYSIHRGALHRVLVEAVRERLGAESVATNAAFESLRQGGGELTVRFSRASGEQFDLRGCALIGADGVHSAVRKRFYPDEAPPRFAQRLLWRGAASAPAVLDGRTIVILGHPGHKFLCHPIGAPEDHSGRQLISWVAELSIPENAPPSQDWNQRVPKTRFAPRFADWRFDWIDAPALIDAAPDAFEYPLIDRDPLPRWTHGLATLLGDAAHPMYPIGANGASQAILDAHALASALAGRSTSDALVAYEAERRPITSKIVLANRQNGPEQVLQLAEARAPQGFNNVHDVLSPKELAQIANCYEGDGKKST